MVLHRGEHTWFNWDTYNRTTRQLAGLPQRGLDFQVSIVGSRVERPRGYSTACENQEMEAVLVCCSCRYFLACSVQRNSYIISYLPVQSTHCAVSWYYDESSQPSSIIAVKRPLTSPRVPFGFISLTYETERNKMITTNKIRKVIPSKKNLKSSLIRFSGFVD